MKKILLFIAMMPLLVTAQQYNGLTLIGSSGNTTLKLIDTNGTTQKQITCTGGNNTYSNYLTKGGFFWRTVSVTGGISGGGTHGKIQKYSWNGTLLWEYTISSSTEKMHHDFTVMPNGNVMVIVYDVRAAGTVTAAGGTYTSAAWYEKLVELEPVGTNGANIVWQWNLWDRNCQATYSALANYVTNVSDHPERFNIAKVTTKDFAHMNGLDFDSARNQVIVSSHFLDEVYVIDHSTTTAEAATHAGGIYGKGGDFLYRYGQTGNYGFTTGNAIDVCHDGHLVRHGKYKDHIAFFHNKGAGANASAADYVLAPRSGNTYTITAGSPYSPLSYTGRVLPVGYSSNMSNVEEFPNGNFMICLAIAGTVKEIDSNGAIIWTYNTGGTCAQAHRYDMCDISLVKPIASDVSIAGSTLSITNPNGYSLQWIKDGVAVSGATSSSYDAGTIYGSYAIQVKDSFGCVVTGNYKTYTDAPENVSEMELNGIYAYPNPASDFITINAGHIDAKDLTATIMDVLGNVIATANQSKKISVQNLVKGNYVLQVYYKGQALKGMAFVKE